MSFPEVLRELRKKKAYTQKEVAGYLNLTRATYGHYETGHAEPSTAIIQKLADFFNVSVDYLLGRTGNQTKAPLLGERLKAARKAKGLTLEDVAGNLRIKKQAYHAYEENLSVPDANVLASIAELFSVSTDSLLGLEVKTDSLIEKEIALSEKDIMEIKQKAEHIKSTLMSSVGLAFDGRIDDDDTLIKVMAALEEGMILAKKAAKEKYTPKKYGKQG